MFEQDEIEELVGLLEWRKEELEDYIADGLYPEEYKAELELVNRLLQKLCKQKSPILIRDKNATIRTVTTKNELGNS